MVMNVMFDRCAGLDVHKESVIACRDLARMADLVYAAPEQSLHVADLPYRLSSPALEAPANGHLWESADGALQGWAIYQPPWGTLDYAIHPAAAPSMEDTILGWELDRFAALGRAAGRPLDHSLEAREDDRARQAVLARHRFVLSDYHLVHLARALADLPSPPALPPGFLVRPLAGAEEVAAYVDLHRAAFGSENMTVPWQRTLLMPAYRPDLSNVAKVLSRISIRQRRQVGELPDGLRKRRTDEQRLPAGRGRSVARPAPSVAQSPQHSLSCCSGCYTAPCSEETPLHIRFPRPCLP